MAYKYAEKNKGKRSENMTERQIAEKEIAEKSVSFFLAQTPLNSQRKVPKIKRKLNPQNKIRKLTNSSPNALIKSPN